jgi:hypothetical protein
MNKSKIDKDGYLGGVIQRVIGFIRELEKT